jgi:NADP-dependent 3-hydroxy acid dehydrogenase YdfG
MASPKVWLITGCPSGFGPALARTLLDHGHMVIGSSRKAEKTPQPVQEIKAKGGHWLALDVCSSDVV